MDTMKDTKMQPAKSAVIEELRNRLEEARTAWKEADKACRDLTEKVIPNLRESLEAAEKDIALKERVIDALGSELNAAANERDALRAKIAAMERQEPLITVLREPDYWSNGHFHKGTKPYISLKQLSKLKIGDNLYALPGSKGEEK